jgi:hypothetical protein
LGSTRKIVKLRKIVENTSYTPPSPIKATLTTFASNYKYISTVSVSKTGDVMMTSEAKRRDYLRKIVSYLEKTHLRAEPPP